MLPLNAPATPFWSGWDCCADEKIDLKSTSTDELWALHEEITSILQSKMQFEKRKLEKRINELAGTFGGASDNSRRPRPYPKVHPKFRNPELPDQTWSGRGKQPLWMRKLLENGKTLDDCRILNMQREGRMTKA